MDKSQTSPCPSCQGKRALRGAVCEACDGTGRVLDALTSPATPPQRVNLPPSPREDTPKLSPREWFAKMYEAIDKAPDADTSDKNDPPSESIQ